MNIKEKIILPTWDLIQDDVKLKKFYFLPGILSIIFLSGILVYQSVYTYVEIFGNKDKILLLFLKFLESDYIMEAIVATIVFILAYIVIVPIFEGGLVNYIDAKHKKKDDVSGSDCVSKGFFSFLPIFEFNNIFAEFKFISVLNLYLFAIRFVNDALPIKYVNYIFIFLFIISIIVNILFAYTKLVIVLENKKAIPSITTSSKIAILNLGTTFKLYFLMFLINLRVIFNFLVFLTFPILIILAFSFITSKIFLTLTIVTLVLLFIGLIIVLGYLTAVLEVFKNSIWYFAYLEGKKKLDEEEEEN